MERRERWEIGAREGVREREVRGRRRDIAGCAGVGGGLVRGCGRPSAGAEKVGAGRGGGSHQKLEGAGRDYQSREHCSARRKESRASAYLELSTC